MSIKIYGLSREEEAHVYLSGFKAQYKGNNHWRYWGPPHEEAFLTVVSKDTLIYRKKIRNSSETPYSLTIPAPLTAEGTNPGHIVR